MAINDGPGDCVGLGEGRANLVLEAPVVSSGPEVGLACVLAYTKRNKKLKKRNEAKNVGGKEREGPRAKKGHGQKGERAKKGKGK